MPLCKWLYSLPTIGKKSLFTVTHSAGCYRSALHHISFVLFLKSRMYDACCSTNETASLRMFKYGRTDAIRVTTVDSLKFVQAMQDSTKQVLFNQWSFTINVQFKGTVFAKIKIPSLSTHPHDERKSGEVSLVHKRYLELHRKTAFS